MGFTFIIISVTVIDNIFSKYFLHFIDEETKA